MSKRSVLDMYYGPRRAKQTEEWYTSEDSQSFAAFIATVAMDIPFNDGIHLSIKAAYAEGLMRGFQDAVAAMPISSLADEQTSYVGTREGYEAQFNDECACNDCVRSHDERTLKE